MKRKRCCEPCWPSHPMPPASLFDARIGRAPAPGACVVSAVGGIVCRIFHIFLLSLRSRSLVSKVLIAGAEASEPRYVGPPFDNPLFYRLGLGVRSHVKPR